MFRKIASSVVPAAARRLATANHSHLSPSAALKRPFGSPLETFARSTGIWGGSSVSARSRPFRLSVASFSGTAEEDGAPDTDDQTTTDSDAEATAEDTDESQTSDSSDDDSSSKEKSTDDIIAELEAQVKEKHEHMMMAYANEQNALRIAKDDVAKAREFAVQSFAKNLLEVADNLHRARDAVPADAVEEESNEMLRQLLEGVKMTEDGLLKVFRQNGIEPYGEVGDAFDANLHEALYMYKDPTATPGTLGQVVQIGYMLKKRVLRPVKAGIIQKDDTNTNGD